MARGIFFMLKMGESFACEFEKPLSVARCRTITPALPVDTAILNVNYDDRCWRSVFADTKNEICHLGNLPLKKSQ